MNKLYLCTLHILLEFVPPVLPSSTSFLIKTFHPIANGRQDSSVFYSDATAPCKMLPELIQPSDLKALLDENAQVQIVDTREADDFRSGHIPGAVNIPELFTYLISDSSSATLEKLRSDLASRFGESGIQRQNGVVVYEETLDTCKGASCRGYFLLKYLGCEEVAVLDGGFRRWRSAGFPASDFESTPTPVNFEVIPKDKWMVSKEEMFAALKDPQVVLLDCRDADEWYGLSSSPYGVDFCPRKGRIPGSKWIEWLRLMTQDAEGNVSFQSPEEIQRIAQEAAGIQSDTAVFIFCFKGARAANTLLALRLAGVRDVRNYFASWNEWSRDFDLPVDSDILSP